MTKLPMMKPTPALRCTCGERLEAMRLRDGYALGHLGDLDSEAIVAPTLKECVAEFKRSGLQHSEAGR